MAKRKRGKQKATNKTWLLVGLAGTILAAPNNSFTKYSLDYMSPLEFTVIRTFFVAIIALPLVLMTIPRMNRTNLKYTLLTVIFMLITALSFVYAVDYGEANFITILSLASPALLVVFSAKLTKEKINHKALAGVALAALGAFVIIFGPIAASGGLATTFYPVSALLIAADVVFFPLVIIYSKKAADNGMPIPTTLGLCAISIFIVAFAAQATIGSVSMHIPMNALLTAIYTGVGVIFISRILNVMSYRHLGSAVVSTLFYLELFISLLFSTLWLNEKIAISSLLGGCIILFGIYLTEHHKSRHLHLFHALKHH